MQQQLQTLIEEAWIEVGAKRERERERVEMGGLEDEVKKAAEDAPEAFRKLAEEASKAEDADGLASVAKSAVQRLAEGATKRIDTAAHDAHTRSDDNKQEVYDKLKSKTSHPCNEIAEDFVRAATFASSDSIFGTARDLFTCVFVPGQREEVLRRHHDKLRTRLEELEKAQAERIKKQEEY
ncbi:Hypothetical Protein FCC1311_028342 [Hondaea fermentalgiana]|uniref:Uncharacterized protein n=1 Tax=Hondaea fermentalgiana TaxID=2315210 RepID=A0A2R5GDB1_9STRA|nr:Hypothetical Protein FCC1311_028342 [Hondaea fermentalgiana]|eukprot:GBG26613.1 Hypothetical Protein FCC1311_028342 [Hondaea fermentalgiana]